MLNSLLKSKKTESFVILYHSEWCEHSNIILKKAQEWAEEEGGETLYVVSSWELPHAFAAFAVSTAPTVVEVVKGRVMVHSEYPKVYDYFTNNQKGRSKRPRRSTHKSSKSL